MSDGSEVPGWPSGKHCRDLLVIVEEKKKPIVKPETYQVLHSPQMFSSRLYRWSCHHYKPHSDPRQRWTQSPGHSLPSETHIQNRKFHNILSIFYLD